MHEFLGGVKSEMNKNLSDDYFLMFLSFLVDILKSINFVNLKLQAKEENVLQCHEKLKAFNTKLIPNRSKKYLLFFVP